MKFSMKWTTKYKLLDYLFSQILKFGLPTVADGISNGNANGPFRNDFTSPAYLICIFFLEVQVRFFFSITGMKNGNRKKEEDENVH